MGALGLAIEFLATSHGGFAVWFGAATFGGLAISGDFLFSIVIRGVIIGMRIGIGVGIAAEEFEKIGAQGGLGGLRTEIGLHIGPGVGIPAQRR